MSQQRVSRDTWEPTRRAQLEQMHLDKKTHVEIAKELRVSARTVARRLRAMGYSGGKGGRPRGALDSQLGELYDRVNLNRISMDGLAQELGITVRTLERYFRKYIRDRRNQLRPYPGAN